jgi:AcrR family transcriptional regulator/DNA-binding MarR family transcriptional regulator
MASASKVMVPGGAQGGLVPARPGTRGGAVRDGAVREVERDGGRGGVAEIQRARMIAAMVDVARERGVAQVTVAHVVARSGVSRRTFYELFEDREACLMAAFDEAVGRAALTVLPAFRGAGTWCERMRAALAAFLEFLEVEPSLGAFCVVDALGAGPRALERRARVVQRLVDAVDEGRAETRGSLKPTRLTAEGVVGALLGVLHARLAENWPGSDGARRLSGRARPSTGSRAAPHARERSIVELSGALMGMIVLPYQGQAVAAREAARPAPKRRRIARTQRDPLWDLDMRLTYRTVRVLLAIAEHPGASNREVADASGVQDQGQISKLLARLGHLGLIQNRERGFLRGEPNVWRLTSRGQEIERSIRQQAAATV